MRLTTRNRIRNRLLLIEEYGCRSRERQPAESMKLGSIRTVPRIGVFDVLRASIRRFIREILNGWQTTTLYVFAGAVAGLLYPKELIQLLSAFAVLTITVTGLVFAWRGGGRKSNCQQPYLHSECCWRFTRCLFVITAVNDESGEVWIALH